MNTTRLKIIEGDNAEIAEGKVNHFLASAIVYSVVHIAVHPKAKEDPSNSGFYCYITYKEKYDVEEN